MPCGDMCYTFLYTQPRQLETLNPSIMLVTVTLDISQTLAFLRRSTISNRNK